MIACPACRTENPEGARFCSACGSSLVPGCTRCGAELPEGARFCSTCGQPVETAREPGRERKVVSILFADVSGSTALGEKLEPEQLTDVMSSFFAAMRQEIEAEGGTVEKYIGDAVMAAFGVPVAHEDDPARAVRAAQRMQRALESLNAELAGGHGVTLQIRIGINTGEVIAVTDPRPGEAMVTGDAVNAAARLEQTAEPGQVLVSERTARAARGFRFREVGPMELRGREETITALEVIDDRPAPAVPSERGVPGLRAPLVGRDEEMDLLQSLFRRVSAEERPHLVTIYGDPGVGKSRLTAEFLAWAEVETPALVVRGRCLPYGDGVTYWPLAEILKERAGVLDTDPPAVAVNKIRAFAASVLAEGLSPDPDRAAAALAFTVGLDDPRHDFGSLSPRQVRIDLHAAWRSLFSGLARERPLIVVVEDIHWADAALLDLLEELADRVVGPALLICPSRPELTQRRPGWGGGRRNYSGVFLEPLTPEDSRTLIGHLLTVEELPDSVRRRILERAEGNPFFVEEIIRQLIDERHIVRHGDRWRAAREIEEVVIPDTVQGVLAARIDLLEPPEKRTLQSAAVVGRVFWTSPVEQLLNGDASELADLLGRLEDRELVSARIGSSIGGEREYIFKHVLTRDVAYGSLPRPARARAHAQVAEWMERTAGERAREFAELLAHHWVEAFQGIRSDASVPPAEVARMRDAAFHHLLAASDEARSRLALEKAIHLAEQAVVVAADERERSRALETLGDAQFLDYAGDPAWRTYTAAIEATPREIPEDAHQVARLCAKAADIATRWPGSLKTIAPTADEVRSMIELGFQNCPPGENETRVRLLVARAFYPFGFPGDLAQDDEARAVADGEEAAAMALRVDRPDLASAALDALGGIELTRGRYGAQAAIMRRRLELVPQLNDPFELGDLYAVAAWGEFHIGHYASALDLADEGVRRSETFPAVTLHCLAWRFLALVRMGRWDDALASLARQNEILGDRWEDPPPFALRAFGAAAYVLDCLANRGAADRYLDVIERSPSPAAAAQGSVGWRIELLARRGEFAEARKLVDAMTATSMLNHGLILEARCELLAEEGAWEEVPALLTEARAHAAEGGLDALPAFADRLEGRAALAAGRPDEAVRALQRALDRFNSLEAGWESARTRVDLASALVPTSPSRARAEAAAAAEDLERIGAVRETAHARDLLSSLG